MPVFKATLLELPPSKALTCFRVSSIAASEAELIQRVNSKLMTNNMAAINHGT